MWWQGYQACVGLPQQNFDTQGPPMGQHLWQGAGVPGNYQEATRKEGSHRLGGRWGGGRIRIRRWWSAQPAIWYYSPGCWGVLATMNIVINNPPGPNTKSVGHVGQARKTACFSDFTRNTLSFLREIIRLWVGTNWLDQAQSASTKQHILSEEKGPSIEKSCHLHGFFNFDHLFYFLKPSKPTMKTL